jgi:hypothetical protein
MEEARGEVVYLAALDRLGCVAPRLKTETTVKNSQQVVRAVTPF